MEKLHDTYQLTITTLSPLHIGTGSTLRRGFDYVTHKGQTWVFDAAALAELLFDQDPQDFERMAQGAPAGDLIRDNEYHPDNPIFRYVMKGEPRAVSRGAELQEQIKDAWDRPYIPGSSLKGALRTALMYVGWQQRQLQFDPRNLKDNVKFAAQPLEQQVLGGKPGRPGDAPNFDLLRILQVSDSNPDEQKRLRLLNVQVAAGNKTGSPIELEAIPREVTFTASLTLDGFLRKEEPVRQMGWEEDQLKWIKAIPRVANHFTKTRLNQELARWENSGAPIRSFYLTLARTFGELNERSEFLLQLGWGGGWDSKTLGDLLTGNSQAFFQVVKRFERQMDRQRSFRKGDRYPKSRRVIVRDEQPQMPLGWIRVRMERVP
jgi:CRISPR-associated protein Csm5